MKVLIIGINGFVGEYLSELLISKGETVVGTVFNANMDTFREVEVFTMDVCNKTMVNQVIKQVQPDCIYNLSGQSSVALSWKEPAKTIEVNVIGTINLLDAIREYSPNAKLLLVGSSDQYGLIEAGDLPINEERYQRPQNPYATSKKSQEEIGLQYAKAYGLNIIIARAFNHIGPRQNRGFVVSDFTSRVASIAKGLANPTIEVGELAVLRDFTDVRDVVKAYQMIMTSGRVGEVYNVGSGKAVEVSYILDEIIRISGQKVTVRQTEEKIRPIENRVVICDNRKIVNELGWNPQIPLEQSLKETYEYWLNCNE